MANKSSWPPGMTAKSSWRMSRTIRWKAYHRFQIHHPWHAKLWWVWQRSHQDQICQDQKGFYRCESNRDPLGLNESKFKRKLRFPFFMIIFRRRGKPLCNSLIQSTTKNHITIFLELGRDHQFPGFLPKTKTIPIQNPENCWSQWMVLYLMYFFFLSWLHFSSLDNTIDK